MIELTRSFSSAAPAVKVFGLGGAGGNVVDRLILDGFDPNLTVALNTDLQALNGSVSPTKVHLGKLTTRGLGTGGDPELGYAAAEEAVEDVSHIVDRSDLIFLCVGLGGGTGSGAAPLIAHLARKSGATVIALVTIPFGFEGKRRAAQAAEALSQLEQQANLVLCFENDAMGTIVAPTAGIQQAFVATDQTLSQSVRALIAVVQRRGLVNIGLDDLTAALGRSRSGGAARCLFGHGESDSPNRAHEALERAMRNPLMDKGRMLADANHVVVHISGGPDLTLNEVSVLMEEFNRYISESTRVSFGIATDAKLGKRLTVAVVSSTTSVAAGAPAAKAHIPIPAAPEVKAPPALVQADDFFPEAPAPAAAQSAPIAAREPEPKFEPEPEPELVELSPTPAYAPAPVPTPAVERTEPMKTTTATAPTRKYTAAPAKTPATAPAKKEEKAEQMTLEPANRGRFEKSEPTIVDGEDLDVPTFLRKNARR
jgi:cell division protein FtsZ